jgi:hypothetical protein
LLQLELDYLYRTLFWNSLRFGPFSEVISGDYNVSLAIRDEKRAKDIDADHFKGYICDDRFEESKK